MKKKSRQPLQALFGGKKKKKKQLKLTMFRRQEQKHAAVRWGKRLGIVLLIYIAIVAWPLRQFITHGFLTGKTLVLFTNEAEARPCGGFLTAYGTVEFLPPRLKLHNSYALAGTTFGEAEPPLDRVSGTKNFWDLGTSADLGACSTAFMSAYEEATGETIDQVVLFDVQTAEELFGLFGTLKLGDDHIDGRNFFATMSRLVADVDRHDEASLAERKQPLSKLSKKMIVRAVFNPFLLPRASNLIARKVETGNVYTPGISPDIQPERDDFAIIEWNLGGAKSSRFLKKSLKITAREKTPQQWEFFVELSAEHTGGFDEPLSQDWKGNFELILPKFLGVEPILMEAQIAPSQLMRKSFSFEYEGSLDGFSVFRPRGQELHTDITVSLFPQKTFGKAPFANHENVGSFVGKVYPTRQLFRWQERTDSEAPFMTMHTVIDPAILWDSDQAKAYARRFAQSDILAEIHFNELVRLTDDFGATLTDRDFTHEDIKNNPVLADSVLLEDQRTLLLAFRAEKQKDERYFLELTGVTDLHGNPIAPVKRTLIDRK